MKSLFYIIFLLGLFTKCFSQINLVPNSSFEEFINCPGLEDSSRFINYMPPWFSPNYGTPDFLNSCNNSTIPVIGVPYNGGGYQLAHTGNGYADFAWEQSEGCEYLSVKLISQLQEGKKYCVEFYVNLINHAYFGYDRIGAYISKDSLCVPTYGYLHFIPQVENPAGNVIIDTLNWTLISGSFIAQGGEQFITIGNFSPDSLVQTLINDTVIGDWPYYNLDDVSVTLCDSTQGVNEIEWDKFNFNIYPNPVKDYFNIEFSNSKGINEQISISVYNIQGQLLLQQTIKQAITEIDVTMLAKGVYIVKVENSTSITFKKIIKE